jgi:hypothetical protein
MHLPLHMRLLLLRSLPPPETLPPSSVSCCWGVPPLGLALPLVATAVGLGLAPVALFLAALFLRSGEAPALEAASAAARLAGVCCVGRLCRRGRPLLPLLLGCCCLSDAGAA